MVLLCLRKRKIREEEFAFSAIRRSPHYEHERGEPLDHHGVSFDHPLYLVALIAGVLLFCLRRIMLNAEIATELLGSLGLVVDWAENGSRPWISLKRRIASYFAIFMDTDAGDGWHRGDEKNSKQCAWGQ